MKNQLLLFPLVVIVLLISNVNKVKAQIIFPSSEIIALQVFHQEAHTKFQPWTIDWNVASNDPTTYYGIEWDTITDPFSGAQVLGVTKINLQNNNLTGNISASLGDLTHLQEVNLSDNYIKDLEELPFEPGSWAPFVDVRYNWLKFNDNLVSNYNGAQGAGATFKFNPQREFGIGGTKVARPGFPFKIRFKFPNAPNAASGGQYNINFEWLYSSDGLNYTPVTNPVINGVIYFPSASIADEGFYKMQVTTNHPVLDMLVLETKPKELRVFRYRDAEGAEIIPNRMMVAFPSKPNPADASIANRTSIPLVDEATKDTLRFLYGATKIDSCICGSGFTGANDLELWELPDTVSLELERIRRTSRQRARVESSDYDYYVESGDDSGISDTPDAEEEAAVPAGDIVYVGLIDSGVQWDHPDLVGLIYSNDAEAGGDGADDDENCLIDDYNGYDFANDTSYAMDFNGHGTHLAGIILDQANTKIQVINAKASDSTGYMSLFDAVCGMYYAMEHGARVLNLSWGYTGEPCQILEKVIVEAGDPFYSDTSGYLGHDVLIVCSAGNSSNDNDTASHYPSGYNYDHVISVAALNGTGTGLSVVSNYGKNSVDIAAPGTGILSAYPIDGSSTISGTSQAAAAVSRLAAELFQANPNACARGVKDCILGTADVLTGGTSILVSGGKINSANALACISTSTDAGVCHPIYEIKAFLEGPYDSSTGLMNDDLRLNNLIPTIQPFANLSVEDDEFGFPIPLYNGSEVITDASILTTTGNDAIVDWVLVGILDPTTGDSTFVPEVFGLSGSASGFTGSRQACLLQRDGDIVNVDGNPVEFTDRNFGGYVFVMPRNHAAIKSKDVVVDFNTPIVVNLSDGSVPVEGGVSDVINLTGGVYGMISGDLNQDGEVDTADRSQFLLQNGTSPSYENGGDFNLDGEVNAADLILYWIKNENKTASCEYCTGNE